MCACRHGWLFICQERQRYTGTSGVIAKPGKTPDIIIKIETAEAVQNLPELILQAMKSEVFGVMIARGDLAVEIGFERMSEIRGRNFMDLRSGTRSGYLGYAGTGNTK